MGTDVSYGWDVENGYMQDSVAVRKEPEGQDLNKKSTHKLNFPRRYLAMM